jgi:predicted acylesterase/phospholipase RssA
LLFDIVAGTSIGATNAAILVSQFLQTKSWDVAIEKLQSFWIDTKRGLASNPVEEDLEKVPGYNKWKEATDNNNLAASKEEARRYYSAKYFLLHGVPNMYISPYQQRYAFKFFDDESDLTKWYIHSIQPLQHTLESFTHFPIATDFDMKEPRLLVFTVDVAEGETVTFDSYEK